MRPRTSFAVLTLLASLAAPVVAFADDPPADAPPTDAAKAEAKKHETAGTQLFNVQQYDKAADEYQQAYLLDPQPAYLYASAQAQRLGGKCNKALKSYEAYLRANPPESERIKAQKNIDRCQQELKDHPVAEEKQIMQPPDISGLTVPPPPKVEVPPPPPPPKSYLAGHVLLGAGLVVGVTGGLLWHSGKATIDDHNSSTTYDAFASSRDLDSAKTKQTFGVVGMAVGGALVAASVVFYVAKARSPVPREVSASIIPGEARVFLTRSF